MKKVLFVATVDSHILAFHLPYLKYFKDQGYEVHVATNGDQEIPYCDRKFTIPFERSPFKIGNLRAYFELKKVIVSEQYDLIHCHTPVGGVVTRLAARKLQKERKTKIIYTAHGFHFYHNSPKKNWLLFYPIEKYLAKKTNLLITINQEDYQLASKKFQTEVVYVPGVGFPLNKFANGISKTARSNIRSSMGLTNKDYVMVYVAELNQNKNQGLLIEVMAELCQRYDHFHLLLAGKDNYNGYYQKMVVDKGLEEKVHFLGFCDHIEDILNSADLYLSSSLREGLPVNIIEALAVGLPVIALHTRGMIDLIDNGKNGFLVKEKKEMIEKIDRIYHNELKTAKKEMNCFSLEHVMEEMEKNYEQVLKLKVLHILSSNAYSGAENVACTLINHTKDRCQSYYCSKRGPIELFLHEAEISFLPLPNSTFKMCQAIKKEIKRKRPDVVHGHDFKMSIIIASINTNAKRISQLHHNAPFIQKWNLKSLLYRICIPRFHHIIGVSDQILEEAIFRPQMKNHYTTIANYVDFKKVIDMSKSSLKTEYDFTYFGRLSSPKNPIFFLEAVEKLLKNDSTRKALMIGDGELFDDCANWIHNHHLEKQIKMVGFQNNPYPYIKNSKIVIMPSKWEGFGLTAIESVILGSVVLHSGVGGLKSIFETCPMSFYHNINDLAEKMELLLSNQEEYQILSQEEKKAILPYLDSEKWKAAYLQIYRS